MVTNFCTIILSGVYFGGRNKHFLRPILKVEKYPNLQTNSCGNLDEGGGVNNSENSVDVI